MPLGPKREKGKGQGKKLRNSLPRRATHKERGPMFSYFKFVKVSGNGIA